MDFLVAFDREVNLPTIDLLIGLIRNEGKQQDAVATHHGEILTAGVATAPSTKRDVPQMSLEALSREGDRVSRAVGKMAVGGLPPPTPYVPLQRARQCARSHEDPMGNYHRVGSGPGNQFGNAGEDGTLSGTTSYVDRWFEKLFFRAPIVVGNGVSETPSGNYVYDPTHQSSKGSRPPSALGDRSGAPHQLPTASQYRSNSSAARRLRCELFAERAARVLRNNNNTTTSTTPKTDIGGTTAASSTNTSSIGLPPRGTLSTTAVNHIGAKCAYGDALEEYAVVSPARRVISGIHNTSQAESQGNKQARVRSRVGEAIAAAHRIRSDSARRSRPTSRACRRGDES